MQAIALNCSLKRSGQPSSTQQLLGEVRDELAHHGVFTEIVRVADLNILPGVTSDEGPGDDWPALRRKILGADILVLGTPIWLGQPSSMAKRVLERMDAFFGETDEHGWLPPYGRLAAVCVAGNEDGVHHVAAEIFQALNDLGFTLAASASSYWAGEAMQHADDKDLSSRPAKTAQTTRTLAATTVHLARLLQSKPYPPVPSERPQP